MAYLKTISETIRGKVKWAKTARPNKFNKWSVDIYPDNAGLAKIAKLKEEPAIRNFLKRDDDGEYMTFSRDTQKLIRGKMVMFDPPYILQRNPDDPTGKPIPLIDKLVGNGSDCDVEIEVYNWAGDTTRGINPGRGARFKGITVWNLIPFETERDFTDFEIKHVSGLINQPPMPQW